MNPTRWLQWAVAASLAIAGVGCSEKEHSEASKHKPREEPVFSPAPPAETRTEPATQPGAVAAKESGTPALPPGHPPIGGKPAGAGDASELNLKLEPPANWVRRPERMMTLQVYSATKADGDSEDGDIAISTLGRKIELKQNIDFWCTRFELPEGQTCEGAAKITKIEGAALPATLVEIAGAYKGAGMARGGTPKPGYIMLVAEILHPDFFPYYIRLTGPEKTVELHRQAFVDMVKTAKPK